MSASAPTLGQVVAAYVAARDYDRATLGRLAWWADALGALPLTEITPDAVDAALVRLTERGRLRTARGRQAVPSGAPLAPATVNRYIAQLGSLYRWARRQRLVPRAFVPPTQGVERAPEPTDPDRYLRPTDIDRLLAVARVLDVRWGRLPALITLAYHTGLRVGNLLALRWQDVDLAAGTLTVARTKNGRPLVSPLTPASRAELQRLPGRQPDALVFANRYGRPYNFRRLWARVCREAGLEGRNFHQLRHGCGSALAAAGVNQAQIMAVMGHRTLTASARYMHLGTDDKRDVLNRVFGASG